MLAVPVRPSLEALMMVEPRAMAVTTPVPDTDATAGDDDVHCTERSIRTLVNESRTLTISWRVTPTNSESVDGDNTTAATGTGATVICAVPTFPSLVAVTVAVPADMAVTNPVIATRITVGEVVAQTTVRSVSGWPLACSVLATSKTDSPPPGPINSVRLPGFTETVATVGGSVEPPHETKIVPIRTHATNRMAPTV